MMKDQLKQSASQAKPSDGAMEMTPQVAGSMMQSLRGARAMLRAIVVAEAAVADQAINWGPNNGGPDRWHPVMSEVTSRLSLVRDAVIDTAGFTSMDWPAFLLLSEALDAALWHGVTGGAESLDSDELVSAVQVLISMLDDALAVCAAEGVPARAAMH